MMEHSENNLDLGGKSESEIERVGAREERETLGGETGTGFWLTA